MNNGSAKGAHFTINTPNQKNDTTLYERRPSS